MNQRGSMNQRTDEIERILNASKSNHSNLKVSQQPTLYEVQLRYAEDLKQLRQQFEESQQKQEIKDREQAKENRSNKRIAILSVIVAIVSAAFGGASLIVSVIALLG